MRQRARVKKSRERKIDRIKKNIKKRILFDFCKRINKIFPVIIHKNKDKRFKKIY